MKHSSIGASSAYRWMECPGSVALSKDIPNKTSVYAAEGTEAHNLAEKILLSRIKSKDIDLSNTDPDMLEHVNLYASTILGDLECDPGELVVEAKVNNNFLYRGLYGTLDAMIKRPFKKLTVYDLKYGKGKVVEVENNPQAMYYPLEEVHKGDYTEVELVIVQPRAYHPDGPVRRWTISTKELMDWAYNTLKPAAQATKKKDAPLKSGEHCQFCPAIGKCPEIHKTAMEVAQTDFSPVNSKRAIKLPEVNNLQQDQLVKILTYGDLIVKYVNSAWEYAQGLAEGGEEIPGFKLVRKKSNRQWKDEKETEAALLLLTELENKDIFTSKVKSPNQVITALKSKGLKSKEADNMIQDLYFKPDTGLTLVSDKDKRPAVTATAITDFTTEGE